MSVLGWHCFWRRQLWSPRARHLEAMFTHCSLLSRQQQQQKQLEHFGSKKFNKPVAPNYFFCVRIYNKSIIEMVRKTQREIVRRHKKVSSTLAKPETLHVTLLALHLNSDVQRDAVNRIISKGGNEIRQAVNQSSHAVEQTQPQLATTPANATNVFELTFEALSTFGDRVVYIDLVKNDGFRRLVALQKELIRLLQSNDIEVNSKETHFTPHMTLMKLRYELTYLHGIKKYDRKLYAFAMQQKFGVENVAHIHLCKMFEKQEDGFYQIDGTHYLAER